MKRILSYLLLITTVVAGCKKDRETNQDPLYKRWFVYKIEKHYTDKSGNPNRNFKPWSNIIDDREIFFEFTEQGQFLTYEGIGDYRRTDQAIIYTMAKNAGEYKYRLKENLLVLSFIIEKTDYNELTTYEMRPF